MGDIKTGALQERTAFNYPEALKIYTQQPQQIAKAGVSQTCYSISASRPTCQDKNRLRTSTALQAVLAWKFNYANFVSSSSFYFIHLRNMSTKIYNFKSWNVLCELHVSQRYIGHDLATACTNSLLYVSCFTINFT